MTRVLLHVRAIGRSRGTEAVNSLFVFLLSWHDDVYGHMTN